MELGHFRTGLERSGVEVAGAESRGALLLRTKYQAHLIGGCFDCERMLTNAQCAVEDALNTGFSVRPAEHLWTADKARASTETLWDKPISQTGHFRHRLARDADWQRMGQTDVFGTKVGASMASVNLG